MLDRAGRRRAGSVRLLRWAARSVMAGHMADDIMWAGEGSRPFDLRPPPHNDQVHRTTARILIVFPMSAVSRQSLLLDAPVAPARGSSKDASHASISTCRSRSARLLLPPAAIEDRWNRGVCHQEYPQWGRPLQDHHQYSRPGYVRITEDELDGLPSGVSRLLRDLFVPSEGKMYVPTCGTNVIYLNAYLNHSSRPNMRTKDGYTFTTRRMIRPSDELTVDYRSYGAEAL